MPAFVAIDADVHDPARYQEYMKLGQEAVAKYGGRYVVRGGSPEVLEEDWSPKRFVLIEFKDRATAKAWYDSPEYRRAREVRAGAATFRAIVVDGA